MATVEIVAVILNFLAVYYAVKQKAENWFFSILAVFPLMYMFYGKHLYGQLGVQFFYLIYSMYGLYHWDKHRRGEDTSAVYVETFGIIKFVIAIGVIILIMSGIVFYYKLDMWQIIDYLIVMWSIFGTWLLAKRYIENWFLWITIDLFSIILFIHSELYWAASLYFILLFMAISGLIQWTDQLNKQKIIL